jgi:hypothetical protein
MRYTELLHQPSEYFSIDCPVCLARDGWSSYVLLGGDMALGHGLRLGAFGRIYDGHTSGASVGTVPPVKTNDRWVNTYLTLAFSL